MRIQILKLAKKILLFSLLTIVVLPLTLVSASRAQAADKVVPPARTIVTDTTPPVIKGLDNLKTQTFTSGQSIRFRFAAEKNLNAFAQIGNLDPSFAQQIPLRYIDSGFLELETPVLTGKLNVGKHKITILAEDHAGNVLNRQIEVNLVRLPSPQIIYVKVDGQNNLYVSWAGIKNAQNYTVRASEGSRLIAEKTVANSIYTAKIASLSPGTAVSVTVTAATPIGVLQSNEFNLTTFGKKPQVVSIAVKTPEREIKPAIGSGASTMAQIVQNPSTVTTPAPTSEATETPAGGSTKGGWNRLLVALSILIIAAAVAVGGYYGYEWMISKNKENDRSSGERW